MNYMVSLSSNFLNYDNGFFILILKKTASRIKSSRLTYALKKKKSFWSRKKVKEKQGIGP